MTERTQKQMEKLASQRLSQAWDHAAEAYQNALKLGAGGRAKDLDRALKLMATAELIINDVRKRPFD